MFAGTGWSFAFKETELHQNCGMSMGIQGPSLCGSTSLAPETESVFVWLMQGNLLREFFCEGKLAASSSFPPHEFLHDVCCKDQPFVAIFRSNPRDEFDDICGLAEDFAVGGLSRNEDGAITLLTLSSSMDSQSATHEIRPCCVS